MQRPLLIKVVEFFIEDPYREVYLRELAKRLKISPYAAKSYADFLIKNGVINEKRTANIRYFKPNKSNLFFKYLKIAFSVKKIIESGLVDFLKREISNLSSITLFGSAAKGEDDDKSDIDLVVICKDRYTDLSKFEAKLNKKLSLHVFSWSEWNRKAKEDNPFYYEVIAYGIPLFGDLPLVRWK